MTPYSVALRRLGELQRDSPNQLTRAHALVNLAHADELDAVAAPRPSDPWTRDPDATPMRAWVNARCPLCQLEVRVQVTTTGAVRPGELSCDVVPTPVPHLCGES